MAISQPNQVGSLQNFQDNFLRVFQNEPTQQGESTMQNNDHARSCKCFYMSLLFLIQVHMFWKVSISMFLVEMTLKIICPHISQASIDGTPVNSVGAWVGLFVEFLGTPIFREMRTITVQIRGPKLDTYGYHSFMNKPRLTLHVK